MKKSQGEIFGIALFFVVIIVGILIYSQIKASDPLRDQDTQKNKKYSVLAESTVYTLLETSTGCSVTGDDDSLKRLIQYCVQESYGTNGCVAITKKCQNGATVDVCDYGRKFLEKSLMTLFNSTKESNNASIVGKSIPYKFTIQSDKFPNRCYGNVTVTNLGKLAIMKNKKPIVLEEDKMLSIGFKRETSQFIAIPVPGNNNLNVELYVWYQ